MPDADTATAAPAATAADLIGGTATTSSTGEGAEGTTGGGASDGSDVGGAADPDWFQYLSTEAEGDEPSLRDWAKAANVRDIDGLAKIARDNMKALRDSGRFKVPGEGATEAELTAYRKAIGVPDDFKGYKMPTLKNDAGEPVELNNAKLEVIARAAHKAGIPAAALEATLQEITDADALELATAEADIQARAVAHAKKWGAKEAENTAAVGRAVKALGLEQSEALAIRAALGPERALDVFQKLGAGLGEDTMVEGGGRQRFGLSGAEAQAQLDSRMKDKAWSEKALIPGTAERAEYDRLNAAVGEAANRKAIEEGVA